MTLLHVPARLGTEQRPAKSYRWPLRVLTAQRPSPAMIIAVTLLTTILGLAHSFFHLGPELVVTVRLGDTHCNIENTNSFSIPTPCSVCLLGAVRTKLYGVLCTTAKEFCPDSQLLA